MRTLAFILTLFAAVIGIAVGNTPSETAESSGPDATPSASVQILGVDELMQRDQLPQTPLQVEGIVSATSADEGSLALIDRGEFDQCRVTTCAQLVLPVRWRGAMPSIRDAVRIQGEVQELDGRWIFVATHLETLKTISRKIP